MASAISAFVSVFLMQRRMQGSNWHIVKNQPTWQEQTTGHSVLSGLFFKTRKVWDTTLWDASKRLEASRVTLTGMILIKMVLSIVYCCDIHCLGTVTDTKLLHMRKINWF